MKISNQELIENLIERTKENINQAEFFSHLEEQTLNWKSSAESWSILECFEHLNRYGDFYLPEIEKRIMKGVLAKENATFNSGWLGNYFAKSMLPKEKLNKMNSPKSMNPKGSKLNSSILKKFIQHQKKMLQLLSKARNINLAKTKTSISLSKWIKLRLGDTLRVVIYHNQRHMIQAQNALALCSTT